LTACASDSQDAQARRKDPQQLRVPVSDGVFVKAGGTGLTLDGKPFYFLGVNIWGLASDPTIFSCGAGGEVHRAYLDRVFADLAAKGVNAVRFFALQSYTAGKGDLTALKQVFASARAHDMRLIPVLGNNYADCDYYPQSARGMLKDTAWYRDGYKQPYSGYTLSYRDYASWVVQSFKDDPTVLMWQLINEAHVSAEGDAKVLRDFAADMTQLVKALDGNHLLSVGTQGTGQAGIHGSEYRALHSLPQVDVVEAHDYDSDTAALPGYPDCSRNCIWSAMQDARELNKPFFIGEAGVIAGAAAECKTTLPRRADQLTAKAEALFRRGGAGYLFWAYSGNPSTVPCSHDIAPDDPLFARFDDIVAAMPLTTPR
jgi:endo-1,4-beta-mannosidase